VSVVKIGTGPRATKLQLCVYRDTLLYLDSTESPFKAFVQYHVTRKHAVGHLVKALRYQQAGREFDSR
jgi:hypothetical protein